MGNKLRHVKVLAKGSYEAPATTGTPNRSELVTSALEIPPSGHGDGVSKTHDTDRSPSRKSKRKRSKD